jgi:hypothetical protein
VKILSIEPTPSPNTMKLNLNQSLPKGVQRTYTTQSQRKPELIHRLLCIDGVRSIFHTADFIAVDRYPQGNWQQILSQVREVFGESGVDSASSTTGSSSPLPDSWGEVRVYVQMFRDIPMQLRLQEDTELLKVGLPERFAQAGIRAGSASFTLLKERKLVDWGIRYGELADISEQLVQEIEAAYPTDRLEALVIRAIEQGEGEPEPEALEALSADEVLKLFENEDWKLRYAALQRLRADTDVLSVLARAIQDPETSIRRQAVVELGELRSPEALPYLFRGLKDRSASVRRTAGDTLNDIGDPAAIAPMMEALKDSNKLVRWRAARFLYEYGDDQALEALKAAENDSEFEVSLQVRMAIARIEGGAAAEGSVWQQMTRRNQES